MALAVHAEPFIVGAASHTQFIPHDTGVDGVGPAHSQIGRVLVAARFQVGKINGTPLTGVQRNDLLHRDPHRCTEEGLAN